MSFTPRQWQNHSEGGTDTLDADSLIDLEQRVYDAAVADAVAAAAGPVSGYRWQQEDRAGGTFVYVGYLHADGRWFIARRTESSGLWLTATGASGYTTAWTGRAGLTYS